MIIMLQGLMVATGEVTGFDLEKKKVEVCTKKGKFNEMVMRTMMMIVRMKMMMIVMMIVMITMTMMVVMMMNGEGERNVLDIPR